MKSVITCAIALTALIAFASTAKAQTCDPIFVPEGSTIYPEICGFVWSDDGDGMQEAGESGLNDVQVLLFAWIPENGYTPAHWDTDAISEAQTINGYYYFDVSDGGLYKVVVSTPDGTSLSPQGQGDDTIDSDGVNGDSGGAAAFVCLGTTSCPALPTQIPPVPALSAVSVQDLDFGFHTGGEAPLNPGTGTPGYWKNHPEAWAAAASSDYVDVVGNVVYITIGGTQYTQEQAINYMGKVSKHKSVTIFSSLVSAILNVGIGNDSSCISGSISAAQTWLHDHPVEGPAVAASSPYWQAIEGVHKALDDYNNGRLCAPHRN